MTDYKLFVCMQCGFEYDEAKAGPRTASPRVPAGTTSPIDWSCPDCGAAKSDFDMVEVARG